MLLVSLLPGGDSVLSVSSFGYWRRLGMWTPPRLGHLQGPRADDFPNSPTSLHAPL